MRLPACSGRTVSDEEIKRNAQWNFHRPGREVTLSMISNESFAGFDEYLVEQFVRGTAVGKSRVVALEIVAFSMRRFSGTFCSEYRSGKNPSRRAFENSIWPSRERSQFTKSLVALGCGALSMKLGHCDAGGRTGAT